jgi:hypothetical protein
MKQHQLATKANRAVTLMVMAMYGSQQAVRWCGLGRSCCCAISVVISVPFVVLPFMNIPEKTIKKKLFFGDFWPTCQVGVQTIMQPGVFNSPLLLVGSFISTKKEITNRIFFS